MTCYILAASFIIWTLIVLLAVLEDAPLLLVKAGLVSMAVGIFIIWRGI
jgi:hypothetical protein